MSTESLLLFKKEIEGNVSKMDLGFDDSGDAFSLFPYHVF
jgi:hypothetical protein